MDCFEQKFAQAMKGRVPLLDKITNYILRRKGKQMRPMFVFLSCRLLGNTSESSYTAASMIELLHTATLVHDDVVDDALERRGFFSLNALWKNKIAVLIGDYLLSKGLLIALNNNEHRLLMVVSNAVREMSEGELLQIEKARRLDIDEAVYFEIIRQKTASLIAACCACGAVAAGQNEDTIEKMRLFGEYTGIAFQIKDDLFDYGSGDIGKPTGIDIKEKKLTLPLIYTLNKLGYLEKRKIIRTVKYYNTNSAKVNEVIEQVKISGGIEYAEKKMLEYRDKAIEILNCMPNNQARESLMQLVNYTVERSK